MKNFFVLSTILFICLSSQAWNARYVVDAPIRWHSDTNTTGFKLQPISFPVGSALRSSMVGAISILNANPSLIQARLNEDSDWVSVSNGVNEIWFTDNNLVLMGAPAICIHHFNPFAFGVWNMTEADVIFNVAETYTTSRNARDTWPFMGNGRPFQTTALHELGHAMGMQHENTVYNLMGEDWTHVNLQNTTLLPTLGEDTTSGLVRIYSANPRARADVSVTNFKYSGVSGEYSTHQRTEIRAAIAGESVSPFFDPADADEPNQLTYSVRAGQFITVEFTYENNGGFSLSAPMSHIVFSTNRTITTRDQLFVAHRIPMIKDRPLTRTFLIRIPQDARPGSRYYIGAIIDAENTLTEVTKRNNSSYIPIFILNP
jgi:hypothetical protein